MERCLEGQRLAKQQWNSVSRRKMMTKLLILALLVVAACVAANARVRNFDPSEIDGTWAAHAGNCVADRYARITFFNKGSSFVSSTYLLSSYVLPFHSPLLRAPKVDPGA